MLLRGDAQRCCEEGLPSAIPRIGPADGHQQQTYHRVTSEDIAALPQRVNAKATPHSPVPTGGENRPISRRIDQQPAIASSVHPSQTSPPWTPETLMLPRSTSPVGTPARRDSPRSP